MPTIHELGFIGTSAFIGTDHQGAGTRKDRSDPVGCLSANEKLTMFSDEFRFARHPSKKRDRKAPQSHSWVEPPMLFVAMLLSLRVQVDGNHNRVHASLKSSRGPRGMSVAGSP